jgi:hypothetical protein
LKVHFDDLEKAQDFDGAQHEKIGGFKVLIVRKNGSIRGGAGELAHLMSL